jgi:ABC-2 type transport system permease protein
LWFARHEINLALRDWISMMTAGRRHNRFVLFVILAIVALILHLVANAIIGGWVKNGADIGKATLVMLTGSGLLSFSLMMSQAMESVTRAYYTRSDLDLILSSPASSRRLFAVRTGAIAVSTTMLSSLLASPFINMLALHDGAKWLSSYLVLAALGCLATALSVTLTLALFRTIGPKRTRLIAQIVAAIIGAAFIIGIQAVAIIAYGNLSRFAVLQSPEVVMMAPAANHWLWIPAFAAMGDASALTAVIGVCLALLLLVIVISSRSFGHHAVSASGVFHTPVESRTSRFGFRAISTLQTLRKKEWALLRRDPWLVSQTLMQILYLVPPAMLMWINFGADNGALVIVIPVLVMSSGQLAGGLAWLAISGEDAPDLVATAPVADRAVLVAKIQAVIGVIGIILLPLIVAIALVSPLLALVTTFCSIISSCSSTAIQLWFRAQAKRTMFRRRQVSSRTATLAEAFSSIMWAGTAGLLAVGSWLSLGPALTAIGVLAVARSLRPVQT